MHMLQYKTYTRVTARAGPRPEGRCGGVRGRRPRASAPPTQRYRERAHSVCTLTVL